ncbi:glycosyltransferase family 1 protein [Thermophilibacter sp.]
MKGSVLSASKPQRILQVLPGGRSYGGVEAMLLNYYRHIDRSQVQFDFLVHYSEEGACDEEIRRLGGKIYYLNARKNWNIAAYINELRELFINHPEYKIIHGHMPGFAPIYFKVAERCGVPVRIAHSHVTGTEPTVKGFVLDKVIKQIKHVSNVHLACSRAAGSYMFGNDYALLPNAIETQRFAYNSDARARLRKQIGIEDRLVVGNIGRLSPQKNQRFLIEVFAEIKKKCQKAALLIAGAGELEHDLQNYAITLGMKDSVYFLGQRADVDELYSVFDVFVLPSLFEGFPVVLVEAQANGCPCVASSTITNESSISNLVSFMSLNDAPEKWASFILEKARRRDKAQITSVVQRGFDISRTAGKLAALYRHLISLSEMGREPSSEDCNSILC